MQAYRSWLLAATLAASAGLAKAQSPADAVVQQLREQGYVEFAVTRTLLGRVRVVALAPDGEQREIVFNPATGEILRDYNEAADGSAAPRVLDRSDPNDRPQTASSPSSLSGASPSPDGNAGSDPAGGSPPGSGDDGNRGHGNDENGDDGGNPGRGNGTDGNPGRSNDGNPSRSGPPRAFDE